MYSIDVNDIMSLENRNDLLAYPFLPVIQCQFFAFQVFHYSYTAQYKIYNVTDQQVYNLEAPGGEQQLQYAEFGTKGSQLVSLLFKFFVSGKFSSRYTQIWSDRFSSLSKELEITFDWNWISKI